MSESRPPEFGINSWLEDELYQQYLHDRRTVDESWKKVFESNGRGRLRRAAMERRRRCIPNGSTEALTVSACLNISRSPAKR